MTNQEYQLLISEGIKNLPPETLAEIVDFIYFMRRKALDPQVFSEELRSPLLNEELRQFSKAETSHLEKEFEEYAQRYPREE